ncbi:MAG: acyl--CoA ligase [Desulfobacteraceae bacterium]|nr:acyl--CoA ligase [Desulfobacteraceae bacterium]
MTDTQDIYSVFADTARKAGDRTAVIFLGTRYSYRELKAMAEAFAAALTDHEVRPGSRVVLYLPNSVQWVVAWLGVLRAGGVCVPITPIYTPRDLSYIANDSDAEAIVCADTNFGYVQQVLPQTRLRQVVVVRMDELLPPFKRFFGWLFDKVPRGRVELGPEVLRMKPLLKRHRHLTAALPEPGANGGRLAEILYTGGTTKHPKGVPISHELFLISADEQIRVSEPLFPAGENVILGNAPLFHILGQTCSLATLLVGGALMVLPRVNLDAAFDAIERFGVRTMIGVPTLYRMILEHDRLDHYDLGSVEYWYSAGDVLPEEVGRRWKKRFGKPIYQGYGATETCGGVTMCPTDRENPPKSVGQVVPSKRVMIVDPAFLKPVQQGKPGELLVWSNPMVSAYIKKPEETAAAFVELEGRIWYRTADVVRMDEEGFLYFVDRTVDTIKHKGYRVSASEIEAVLQEHHAVVAACVVGIADEKVGERIKAYVVLKEGVKGITGYELIKWCRKSLVAYKVPQYIEFRDMLPKSKVGKLLRREIRDEEKRMSEQGECF